MVSEYVKSFKAQLTLRSDVNELQSNEILLKQLENGDTSFEAKREEIQQPLAEKKAELQALTVTPLDFDKLTSSFPNSPPLPKPDFLFIDEDAGTSTVGAAGDPPSPPPEVRFNQFDLKFSFINALQLVCLKDLDFSSDSN